MSESIKSSRSAPKNERGRKATFVAFSLLIGLLIHAMFCMILFLWVGEIPYEKQFFGQAEVLIFGTGIGVLLFVSSSLLAISGLFYRAPYSVWCFLLHVPFLLLLLPVTVLLFMGPCPK